MTMACRARLEVPSASWPGPRGVGSLAGFLDT